MDGSITQLGLSNYLINSQSSAISFFQHSYKNHTNFAKDTRELNFKNGINFGQTAGFRFDEDGKYGDLITNIIIAIDLPDISTLTNINGHPVLPGWGKGPMEAVKEFLRNREDFEVDRSREKFFLTLFILFNNMRTCYDIFINVNNTPFLN